MARHHPKAVGKAEKTPHHHRKHVPHLKTGLPPGRRAKAGVVGEKEAFECSEIKSKTVSNDHPGAHREGFVHIDHITPCGPLKKVEAFKNTKTV